MSTYTNWKPSKGTVIGDGQCVSEVVNNSGAYVEALWPGATWTSIIGSVVGAKDLLSAANPAYFDIVYNDHNNPNQLPPVGAIMVFDKTPSTNPATGKPTGNQFNNPYGHDGIADGNISQNGFDLAQQNAPSTGQGFNVTHYDWDFRVCLGWLVPKVGGTPPTPTPTPTPTAQTITLPQTTGPWHLYKQGGPYNPANSADVLGLLQPQALHEDLTYPIVASRGNGVYTIDSEDFGRGDLWTNGSDVIIK